MPTKTQNAMKHSARILLGNNRKIGKRTYYWDVPQDLLLLSKKINKPMIGVGQWLNAPERKYVCITSPELKNPIYLEFPMLVKAVESIFKGL